MFSTFARAILPRSGRLAQARGMAYITTESPKTSGVIYLVGGLALFIASATLVQTNGLVIWGTAPDRNAALKK